MGSEELRLASFYDWPLTAMVRPELLAAAGFFHTGQQDKVRCFFCHGGLQSWQQGDDPWTEHAKWFPRCEFLLQTKGRDFVCSVQESCCNQVGSWDQSGEPEDAAPSDARGGQEWSAWSQCPAVRAALQMGFGRSQVQQLVLHKYHWAVPTSMSASQLVADLLQEEEGSQALGARGAPNVEEQLQRLQEEQTCKVCLDRAVSVVFVPCGHLVCAVCAPVLQLCPICRAHIRSCVRAPSCPRPGLGDVRTGLDSDPEHTLSPLIPTLGTQALQGAGTAGGSIPYFSPALVLVDIANRP